MLDANLEHTCEFLAHHSVEQRYKRLESKLKVEIFE